LWLPHEGQKPILRALFHENVKDIFVQAGRNFGKTEVVAYALWRYAMLTPGSENYYFAPFIKQAKEILWASGRLQTLGPKSWLQGDPNATEARITFKNGAFIKLDGSDNIEAYRGVKPRGLVVYDEFKDFRPGFYEAFDPNRAMYNSPLIVIGTPPEIECHYTELAETYKNDASKRYFHAPTRSNPYVSKEWLEKKEKELLARGESDTWEREYEARFVRGGRSTIFPMFNPHYHVSPHDKILAEIEKTKWDMEWVLSVDPATISTFGGLVACANPYTRQLYICAELYESTQANTSVTQIVPRLQELKAECFSYSLDQKDRWEERWLQVCDEAEAWFINEALDRFSESFHRTSKATNDKEYGISLIRDLMIHKKIIISDRCENLIREISNYVRSDSGRIAKKNDHVLDCLRYLLHALNYSLNESVPANDTLPLERRDRMIEISARDSMLEEERMDDSLLYEYF